MARAPGDCRWRILGDMVRPERFELPTCCSGGNRSIQLSYGRARIFTVYMGKGNGFNVNVAACVGESRLEDAAELGSVFTHQGERRVGSVVAEDQPRPWFRKPAGAVGQIPWGDVSLVAVAPSATTAAAAAAISAIAPTATSAAATAFGLGPRFIDVDGASAD